MGLKGACAQYNDLYMQAAKATKNLFEVVSELMSQLIDVLIIINAAGAIGTATIETGIGPVLDYSVAAFYAWQAYKLYEEISILCRRSHTGIPPGTDRDEERPQNGRCARAGCGANSPMGSACSPLCCAC
jgi:hypothetical protein